MHQNNRISKAPYNMKAIASFNSTLSLQKKNIFVLVFILIHCGLSAQVSNYSFTQATTSYPGSVTTNTCNPGQAYDLLVPGAFQVGIHPPNQLKYIYAECSGSAAALVSGAGFPIGFDFIYDGKVFDRFAVAANGYIKLGKSGETITLKNDTTEGGVFSSVNNDLHTNIISVQQKDVASFAAGRVWDCGIKYYLLGLPGFRQLVIEWVQISNNTSPMQGCAFSLTLFEGSNIMKMMYINHIYPGGNAVKASIGLRGKAENNNISNLNIRKIISGTSTWSASVAGTTASDRCDLAPSCLPAAFLTYTWTPPVSQPMAPACPLVYFISTFLDTTGLGTGYIPTHISNTYYYKMTDNSNNVVRNPVLYWSAIPETPTQYDVYLGTDYPATTLVSSNQTGTSYTPPSPFLAANTTYYYKIVPHNAYGTAEACTGQFTTGSSLEYCRVGGGGSFYVKQITFQTISYQLTSEYDLTFKFPETATYTTSLKRTQSYNFYLKLNTTTAPHPFGGADCYVYFDWNQDGDFNDGGETFSLGGIAQNQSLNYSITIPNTALLGKTTMRVRVKDNSDLTPMSSCNATATAQDFIVTITAAPGCETFAITPVQTQVKCFGESSGSIDLNASGGTSPYVFSWTDGSSTDEMRSDLIRGAYQATASDANGCMITTPLMAVLQPAGLTLDTTTGIDGTTDLIVTGGTLPYSFLWSNNSTSSDPDQLAPGIYDLTLTDAKGCSTTMNTILVKSVVSGISYADWEKGILVYPNPTSNWITISGISSLEDINIELVSEYGQSVLKTKTSSGKIDLSIFPNGIYILKVNYEDKVLVKKILVSR